MEIEIPGSMPPSGEPATIQITLHNEINVPLAYDVRIKDDPEPYVELVIRKPTAKEHSQAVARARTVELVRSPRREETATAL